MELGMLADEKQANNQAEEIEKLQEMAINKQWN